MYIAVLTHDPRFETRFGRPSYSTTGPKWLVYIAVLTHSSRFETRFRTARVHIALLITHYSRFETRFGTARVHSRVDHTLLEV